MSQLPAAPRQARYTLAAHVLRATIALVLLGVSGLMFYLMATNGPRVRFGARKELREHGVLTTGKLERIRAQQAYIEFEYEAGGRRYTGRQELGEEEARELERDSRDSTHELWRNLTVNYKQAAPGEHRCEHHPGFERSRPSGWRWTFGEITKVRTSIWFADYAFDIDGERYEGEAFRFTRPEGEWPAAGATVEILYLPDNPAENVSELDVRHMHFRVLPGKLPLPMLALLASVIAIVLFERFLRARRRLYVHAREGRATVLEIAGGLGNWMNVVGGLLRALSNRAMPTQVTYDVTYAFKTGGEQHERRARLSEHQAKGLEEGAGTVVLVPPDRVEGHRLLCEIGSWVRVPKKKASD